MRYNSKKYRTNRVNTVSVKKKPKQNYKYDYYDDPPVGYGLLFMAICLIPFVVIAIINSGGH